MPVSCIETRDGVMSMRNESTRVRDSYLRCHLPGRFSSLSGDERDLPSCIGWVDQSSEQRPGIAGDQAS